MKRLILLAVVAVCCAAQSCAVGKGCPSNGKNVGAERLLSGDAKAAKLAKKAGKFKS